MRTILRPSQILAVSIAALISTTALHAQTWDGGGADNNFGTTLNWNPDGAPVNNGTADLIFGGNTRLTPSVNTPWSVDSIIFNNTAGLFNITGQAITIGTTGIINNDADLQSFGANITVGTPTATINAASGALAFNNGLTISGTNVLTLAGSAAISTNTILGTGTINKSNAGAFNFSPVTTLNADLNLSAGATTLVASGNTLTASSSSTIALTGTSSFAINESLILDGAQLTRAAGTALTFGAGKTLTVQNGGDLISAASLTFNGGSVNASGAGSTIQTTTGSSIDFRNGITSLINNGASINSATFLDVGTFGGNATLTVSGVGSTMIVNGNGSYWGSGGFDGTVNLTLGATATLKSVTIGQGTISNTTGLAQIFSGSTVTSDSVSIANGGGAGTGISGGLSVYSGSSWTINGGSTLTVGAATSTVGSLGVFSGGVFNTGLGTTTIGVTGSVTTSGIFNSNGNISQNGQFNKSEDGILNLSDLVTWTVQGGGDATITGNQNIVANNAITVTGAGSTFVMNNGITGSTLNLGGGTTLNVSAGGSFQSNSGNVYIGINNTTASMTVDGTGSTATGRFDVGGDSGITPGGNGTLTFSNSAQGTLSNIYIGSSVGSTGVMNVQSGADVDTGLLAVGGPTLVTSTSTLTVTGAGSTFTAEYIYVEAADGGSATINVNPGAVFTVNGPFADANIGRNGVFNQNAATVFNTNLNIYEGGQFNKNTTSGLTFANSVQVNITTGGDFNLNTNYDTHQNLSISVNGVGSSITGIGSASLFIDENANVSVTNGGNLSLGPDARILVGDTTPGTLTVNGTGSYLQVGGPASSASTIGNFDIGTANFTNNATGQFNALRIGNGGTAAGTLNITGGADVTAGDTELLSGGDSAVINLQGAGSSFTVAGNNTFTLGDGENGQADLNVGSGSVFSTGTGIVTLNSNGRINLNGGTVNLNGPMVENDAVLNFNSGLLNIAGNALMAGNTLLGGDLQLSPSQRLAVGGETTIDPFQYLTITGGQFSTGSLVNNGQLYFNSGTFTITGAGGATIGSAQPLGSSFTLGTGANFVVTNALITAADGVLTLNGGSVTAGSFSNSGQLRINEGVTNITGAVTNNNGGQIFVNDALSTVGALTNATGGRITLRDGTGQLAGAGALVNSGLITGDGRISKALTNNAGGEVRAESGKTIAFTGANAANAGKFNLLGGTLEFAQIQTNGAGGQINGHGTLNFTIGLTNAGQMNFSGGNSDVFGAVNSVTGSRVITSGGSTATFYNAFTNNATEVRTSANSATVFFGLVNGAGPFTGSGEVYYEGGYSPGNSPAIVTSESSVFFGDGNILTMEIGGIIAGTEYDRLVFNGEQLQFGGELVIALIHNFTLTEGMTFDLLDFDPENTQGTFSNIRTAEPLPNGLTIDTSQLESTGSVTVVPEPSSALLCIISGAALGLRRRNHRNQA